MQKISHPKAFGYRFVSLSLIISILTIATSFAATTPHTYDVELAVTEGKKSIETDALIDYCLALAQAAQARNADSL